MIKVTDPALAAILIILAIAAGFVTHDMTIELDHPRGPMMRR